MTLDTNFNFFGLICQCCTILDLDVPTTFEDTAESPYDKLKTALNSVNRSIILMEVERWTFRDTESTLTLVEGVQEYDRPNGLITRIIDNSGNPLDPEYAWDYLNKTGSGKPTVYNVYGDKLLFDKAPTANEAGLIYTIKYSTNNCAQTVDGVHKANMELETDFSLIPTQFSDALIYAACRDYKAMPDRSKYQHYNSRYTQELRQMRKSLKRSMELEPYVDTGGGRSNQDNSQWIDSFFNSWRT